MIWILSSFKFGTFSTDTDRATDREKHCSSNLSCESNGSCLPARQIFVMMQNPTFRSMNQQVVLTFSYRKFFSSSEDLGIETLHPTNTRDGDRNGEARSDTCSWTRLADGFRVVCYNIVTNKQER